jgi:hypothetical protein
MPKLNLPRDLIARIAQGNAQAINALEQVLGNVGDVFPSTIEEANALAGSALTVAQAAVASLSALAEALERIESAPAPAPHVEADDHAPRAHLGTISSQNGDAVEITGGAVDNTPIGQATAAAGKFTTLAASGQIASTVATGAPPLVVASTDKVENLYVARAALADEATHATAATAAGTLTNPTTFPPAATDAASTQTLVNALRAAAIAKGL